MSPATEPSSDGRELERRYRRLLRAFPVAYRRQREDEIVAVLLESAVPGQTRPSLSEAFDLLAAGLRSRFQPVPVVTPPPSLPSGALPPPPTKKPSPWKLWSARHPIASALLVGVQILIWNAVIYDLLLKGTVPVPLWWMGFALLPMLSQYFLRRPLPLGARAVIAGATGIAMSTLIVLVGGIVGSGEVVLSVAATLFSAAGGAVFGSWTNSRWEREHRQRLPWRPSPASSAE